METEQNEFKFNRSLLGKILAVFSFVLAVFSLLLFCVAYLNNKSIGMSDTIKSLQIVSCITIIISSGILVTYYLIFRNRKKYEFLVSLGLITLCLAVLISIISAFINLSDAISKTSKHANVTPMIFETLATVVMPILCIIAFAISTYFVYKKKPLYLSVFVLIPAILSILEFITIPLLSQLSGSSLGAGTGKFIEFYTLCETSLYSCLFVLGLDLNNEYKKESEFKKALKKLLEDSALENSEDSANENTKSTDHTKTEE